MEAAVLDQPNSVSLPGISPVSPITNPPLAIWKPHLYEKCVYTNTIFERTFPSVCIRIGLPRHHVTPQRRQQFKHIAFPSAPCFPSITPWCFLLEVKICLGNTFPILSGKHCWPWLCIYKSWNVCKQALFCSVTGGWTLPLLHQWVVWTENTGLKPLLLASNSQAVAHFCVFLWEESIKSKDVMSTNVFPGQTCFFQGKKYIFQTRSFPTE